jgi:beta-mannanase
MLHLRRAAIAAGSQDATITAAATALKAVGATIYLRPFYEFDQPVGHPRYIGTPGDVVFAWQHTVDIFRAVGATNVKFVWCPMAFDDANGLAPRYWPGAGYVDYVGADGYDFPGSHWFTFARILTAAYNYSVAQARPLFIAETAATATDPRRRRGSPPRRRGPRPIRTSPQSSTSTRSRPRALRP